VSIRHYDDRIIDRFRSEPRFSNILNLASIVATVLWIAAAAVFA